MPQLPFVLHSKPTYYVEKDDDGSIWLHAEIAQQPDPDRHAHHWNYEPARYKFSDHSEWWDGLDYNNCFVEDFVHRREYVDVTVVERETGCQRHLRWDLARHLTVEDGQLQHVPSGTAWPEEIGMPGFVNDPLKDGNIEAKSFTVASDVTRPRCSIAYKTQVDDRVSIAEVTFHNGKWGPSDEIETWASKMPGSQFALVYDPIHEDQRHFIFSEPDGDGYIYVQSFVNGSWQKPRKPRDHAGNEMAIKAHRFSGFAATFDSEREMIFLYFVDESNALMEYAGKWFPQDKFKKNVPAGYRWTRTHTICQNMTLREHFSAIHYNNKTYVVYRSRDHELMLARAKNRGPWANTKGANADWSEFIIREKDQLAKNSPLSVAVGENGNVKVFYLHKERKTETIMALHINFSWADHRIFKPVPVGKLEPGSDICAASLPMRVPGDDYDVRLFSVSKLDGDNVLMERIQRTPKQWTISGGIVDTDVDHLVPKSHDSAHTKVDDD